MSAEELRAHKDERKEEVAQEKVCAECVVCLCMWGVRAGAAGRALLGLRLACFAACRRHR
jgi:hypothetical protein